MLKELVTRFGFEIDDHGLKELEEGISAVKEGILHLGEALVGEAAGLYELVEKTSHAAIEMFHMSQETGIAVEEIQRFKFMAGLAGLSADEFGGSINILARNLTMAKQGSEEARKHFRLLGISTAEIRSGTLTTDKVLERLATRFEKMKDGPEKTGLAMELFGRGGARMIPFLNRFHQALDPVNEKMLGLFTITDAEIEKAEEFHVELEVLKTGLIKIGQAVGFALMPEVTEIIKQMKLWIVENKDLILTNLTEFVKGMVVALKITVKVVDALVKSFAGFAHSIGGVKIATEFLLGTFALLSGATVLWGIGKVIQAVVKLGNEFAIANAKAAAIPLLIGAAMVALFLVMEDIYSFFTGKKSFLGDLLDMLPELGKAFKTAFEPIFEPIVNLLTMITDGTLTWKKAFSELGDLLLNTLLFPLRAILGVVGTITAAIGKVTGIGLFKAGAANAQAAADFFRVGGGDQGVTGVTPDQAIGNQDQSKQVNNDLNVTQQFNFPPGTDPAVVGDKISSSVSSGLDEVLRSTQRSVATGGAY